MKDDFKAFLSPEVVILKQVCLKGMEVLHHFISKLHVMSLIVPSIAIVVRHAFVFILYYQCLVGSFSTLQSGNAILLFNRISAICCGLVEGHPQYFEVILF